MNVAPERPAACEATSSVSGRELGARSRVFSQFCTPGSLFPAPRLFASRPPKIPPQSGRSSFFDNLKQRPAIKHRELAAFALRLNAVAGNTASLRETFRHGAGTHITTLSDNSRRYFVDRRVRFARVFTSFPRCPHDKTEVNCRLGASFRPDDDSQSTSRQRLTRRPKNPRRQNAKNLEPQQQLSRRFAESDDNSRLAT